MEWWNDLRYVIFEYYPRGLELLNRGLWKLIIITLFWIVTLIFQYNKERHTNWGTFYVSQLTHLLTNTVTMHTITRELIISRVYDHCIVSRKLSICHSQSGNSNYILRFETCWLLIARLINEIIGEYSR